jgi:RNA polymerase sigma factor (sigma-70 family)
MMAKVLKCGCLPDGPRAPAAGWKTIRAPTAKPRTMHVSVIIDLLRQLLRIWGPGGEPPQPVLDHIFRKLRTRAPNLLRLLASDSGLAIPPLEELVIAYGLTWGRHRPSRRGTVVASKSWDGVWGPSLEWLEARVFDCMRRASRYLEYGLRVEGYAFGPHPELDHAVAMAMVESFIEGTCPCPKLARENSSEHNFKRRQLRCELQHQLASWNPERCSFFAFVCQAVKGALPRGGAGSGVFQPKSLTQGMHFWHLHHLCGLRLANVLVWVCPTDGSLNFEDLPCRVCLDTGRGRQFDAQAFRTTIQRLLIPWSAGGRYVSLDYWNCQHCRRVKHPEAIHHPPYSFYPKDLTLCPKCRKGRGPGASQSSVYVLAPREEVLEEDRTGRDSSVGSDSDAADEDSRDVEPNDGATAGAVGGEDRSTLLKAALRALPPLSRRVLDLRFTRALTRVEVAQKLKLSPERVRTLETDALRTLRAQLHAQDEESNDYDIHD